MFEKLRFRGRPIYWSNLLRVRFWVFLLFGPLVLGVIVGLIFPPLFVVVWPGSALLIAWFWLHIQMACNRCGRILAVTRLNGQLDVCAHCHAPTDQAIFEQQGRL